MIQLNNKLCKDNRVHVVGQQMEQPPVTLQENVFVFFLWCSVSLLKGFSDDDLVNNEVARYSGEGARDLVHQLKLLCDPVKGSTSSLPD